MSDLRVHTPFRAHYEHCAALDLGGQMRECADHLQHPDVLVMEFMESYHLVEREWTPDAGLRHAGGGEDGELVLEPFYDSLELCVRSAVAAPERLVCVSGSLSPLPEDLHPALSRRGLDYVGMRDGRPTRIVLGVAQASKEESLYLMLLRGLNCLAELSPPLRVVQLGREILGSGIPEDACFDLQLGISERDPDPDWTAVGELARDLAEMFKRRVSEHPQFSGTLGSIECVDIEPGGSGGVTTLARCWRI